jgi:hypothetical protein
MTPLPRPLMLYVGHILECELEPLRKHLRRSSIFRSTLSGVQLASLSQVLNRLSLVLSAVQGQASFLATALFLLLH